ncbi:MAG: chromosome partitioning ATPase [Actinobacteria bacterium 69-20]|nr:AAA family ATPase [Actinomycetota bacterium]OJV24304.1 MAG: chromosome partitioning ATPase [Actinobacteria bacterium 69-20]
MTQPDDAAWIAATGAPRRESNAAAETRTVEPRPAEPRPVDQDGEAVDHGGPAVEGAQGADNAGAGTSSYPSYADETAPEMGPTGRPLRPVAEPEVLSAHGPARVIAMCNQKGGVGKTTSTINLGAALAEYGRRVLLVDLDPQGALSAGLGVPAHELDRTIYNLMLEPSTAVTDVLVPTRLEGVDLLPANIDLSAAEVQLINEVGREQTLARALRPLLPLYDYVLIDCQPSLGLLTVNALACSHEVLMPLAAEFFSLRGVALLVDTVDKVQSRINPDLKIGGVLVTMFDGRTVHARDVVAMLVERFGELVFDTVISRTVKFPETTVAGEPITTYAPASSAAEAYRALAREVIAR